MAKRETGGVETGLVYDPPQGWLYGFPKPYRPLVGESVRDTLVRDGYPSNLADFGSKHCGFSGTDAALSAFWPEREKGGV